MLIADELLCALLRGEAPAWPTGGGDDLEARLIERARYHGVMPLAHDHFQRDPNVARSWPSAVVHACRGAALAQVAWELSHIHTLRQALTGLADIGVQPVLFKGTALAFSLYPESTFRPRADTDLIIPPASRFLVAQKLGSIGFHQVHGVACEFVSYEASFERGELGLRHTLDLHWRMHYSQYQSRLFPYEDLRKRARPLPELGSNAWGVSAVDGLLIACLHRSNDLRVPQWDGNQPSYGSDRLIWLYDVHLLIECLTSKELAEFVNQAERKGLSALCWECIELTQVCFHTRVPDTLRKVLSSRGAAESVTRYQDGGRWRQRWLDWMATEGVKRKIGYVAEHLFPDEGYLRNRYPGARFNWLPWLRMRRLADGMRRRL